MFIRNKDLKIVIGDNFNIDVSIRQLNRLIKVYENQTNIVINKVWNNDYESRVDFISFIENASLTVALKIPPPLPKSYSLCGNPYKYDNINDVNNIINDKKNGFKYKPVKCGKCKKYHMVKKKL